MPRKDHCRRCRQSSFKCCPESSPRSFLASQGTTVRARAGSLAGSATVLVFMGAALYPFQVIVPAPTRSPHTKQTHHGRVGPQELNRSTQVLEAANSIHDVSLRRKSFATSAAIVAWHAAVRSHACQQTGRAKHHCINMQARIDISRVPR